MADSQTCATGSCLCGAVSYEVDRPLRDVVVCHCAMCRKTHGHYAAYSAAAKSALRMTEAYGLRWYQSSPDARRGFCGECGGSVFWSRCRSITFQSPPGRWDAPTGLKTTMQIFVDDAGDYYELPNVPVRI